MEQEEVVMVVLVQMLVLIFQEHLIQVFMLEVEVELVKMLVVKVQVDLAEVEMELDLMIQEMLEQLTRVVAVAVDQCLLLEVQVIHLLQLRLKEILVELEDTLLEVLHQVVVEVQLLQVVMEPQVVALEELEELEHLIIFLVIVQHTLVEEPVDLIILVLQLVAQEVVDQEIVALKLDKMEQQIPEVVLEVLIVHLLLEMETQVDQE